jgi:hypothetical protein
VTEVWLAAKSEAISKVRRTKGGAKEAEAHSPDEKEVEKTFWLSRPDGWVINKKTNCIIMLEFKRTSDTAETYYSNMKSIAERQISHLGGSGRPGRGAGMGGGSFSFLSFTRGRRTAFGQGKRMARGYDIWNERRGRETNHIQAVYSCQSMKNCSEVIGGKSSDPLVVSCICWGKASVRASNSL